MAAPMDDKVRRRLREPNNFEHFTNNHDKKVIKQEDKEKSLNGAYVFGTVFVFFLAIFAFVRTRSEMFPVPKSQTQSSAEDEFYETNARIHLKQFSLHGPRVVGSEANEVFAYQYIVKELRKIQLEALPSKEIVLDEQNATGSFDIQFLSDFVSVYRNIKNVAAMVKSETKSEHSLLMSCHFDSSIDSPGKRMNTRILRIFLCTICISYATCKCVQDKWYQCVSDQLTLLYQFKMKPTIYQIYGGII